MLSKKGDHLYHPEHPDTTDGSLRHIPVVRDLIDRLEAANGEPVCIEDTRTGRENRHICAVYFTHTDEGIAAVDYILLAGFDHEGDDVSLDLVECIEFPEGHFGQTSTDLRGEPFTRTSASMVTDRDSMVDYVKTVEEHIADEAEKFRSRFATAGLSPELLAGAVATGLSRLRPCWRDERGSWKSGDIYFYLLTLTDRLYVIFNGLNAEFEDGAVRLYDGCIDYGTTVSNILEQEGVTDGFIKYYWSNPLRNDDLVVDDSGNPLRGLSPGTSVKDGYFLETNFGILPFNFVIGSGIYTDEKYYIPEGGMCQDIPDDLSEAARARLGKFPDFMDFVEPEQPEPPTQDDDGGCSIASVDEGNLKAAGLSFVLIAAVMFFGGFGGKRFFGRKS